MLHGCPWVCCANDPNIWGVPAGLSLWCLLAPLALWWAKFGWLIAATVSLRGSLLEAIEFRYFQGVWRGCKYIFLCCCCIF